MQGAAGVHKLFSTMAQANQMFDTWHKRVYELAKAVDWTDYDHKNVAMERGNPGTDHLGSTGGALAAKDQQ